MDSAPPVPSLASLLAFWLPGLPAITLCVHFDPGTRIMKNIDQTTGDQTQLAGLYIHIPFCESKCLYCDFYSVSDLTKTQSFLTALEQEMELAAQSGLEFDTIYIGGGTPSVLDSAAIERIIDNAFKHFNIHSNAEITIEVNPGTVDLEDFRRYREFGINRLNIGVQSFHADNLKLLGRIHSKGDAISATEWAREAGFSNIGLDLIYGLPEQTKSQWLADLGRAVGFNPEHLSCYMLTREAGTPLDREVNAGRIHLPAEDNLRRLFEATIEYLTGHGYFHYEVSNFARRDHNSDDSPWKSRHNQKYWSFAPYIGLGPSAHSCLEPQRHWNHRSIEKYLQIIRHNRLPIKEKEILSREQLIMEAIYLGFRTTRGIDLRDFNHRFRVEFVDIFEEKIADFEKDKLLQVTNAQCRLTVKGMTLLDSITAEFTSQDWP
jgi:oxygen-independent coproporphyrinogen-3 oxidase